MIQKYFCLGGIVVATGVMAALAGGYAFYTIFAPKGPALANELTLDMIAQGITSSDLIHWPTVFISSFFGIIWGLIIYNIDRFIVTSTGKGDGTEAITKQEFKGAIPRIIMGMIIALTISKPLEIRMFQAEINARISEEQIKEKTKEEASINDLYAVRVESAEAAIKKFEDQKNTLDSLAISLQPKIDYEIANGGCRDKCNSFIRQQDKYRNDIAIIDSSLRYKKALGKLDELDIEKELAMDDAEKKIDSMDGLLLKLRFAHEEAGWIISLFITLLFMVIELTPIFFKMMLIKGPYDYMDENVKELSRAELGIEIEYNFYADGEGIEKHKVTNHAADTRKNEKIALLKAQDDLNKKIIEEWKKRELKKIEDNPDDYINND